MNKVMRSFFCSLKVVSMPYLSCFLWCSQATVHSTNQWLTELEFNETKLEALALKLLCEGLKDPNCEVQKLK